MDPSKSKSFCQCCLKALEPSESRVPVNMKTREIFMKFIHFSLKPGLICSTCNIKLLTFDLFQRAIRRKHTLLAIEGQNGVERAQSVDEALEYVAKRIKREKPLDIIENQQEQDELKKIVKEGMNPHRSLPVNGATMRKSGAGFEVRKLEKSSGTLAVKPRRDIRRAIINHPPQKPSITPKILTRQSFKSSTDSAPSTSNSNELFTVQSLPDSSTEEEMAIESQDPEESLETFNIKLEQQSDYDDDDDEVIVLPPEPPIDIENLDENSLKPKSNDKMFKCDHCTAVSTKREIIVEHIRKSHRYPCVKKCGKVFPTATLMKEHFEKVHRDPRIGLVGSTKRKQCYMVKEVDLEVLEK